MVKIKHSRKKRKRKKEKKWGKAELWTKAVVWLFIVYILRNTHKYVVNFQSQMISSQLEERTMVSTREKDDTSNKNREDVFTCVKS